MLEELESRLLLAAIGSISVSADMLTENEILTLSASLSDLSSQNGHEVSVDWDDPNATADSEFVLPAISTISPGDFFSSSTDNSVLNVIAVDSSAGTLSVSVAHRYVDDGLAPGNTTPSDTSTIELTVSSQGMGFQSPVNLGAPLNTSSQDRGPTLSPDGLTIYTNSTRPGGLGGEDIWQATRPTLSDSFGPPVNLASVNSPNADTAAAISPDGLSLFFGSGRLGGLGRSDIYAATRSSTSDPFGTPRNLGGGVNSVFAEFAPSITADGQTLYFQRRDDPAGFGSDDIWVSTRLPFPSPDDSFGPAVNLGPTINSSAFEGAPFITDDGLALYFGSNRAGGSGALDLYVATRPSTSDPFGNPVNLGSTINSPRAEFNPHIGPDGLYFQSRRAGGLGGFDLWFAAFADTQTTASIDVTVENSRPAIVSILSTASLDNKAQPGDMVTVSGIFRDDGEFDLHTATVDWNDGTTSTALINPTDRTFNAKHTYSTGGIFEVIVTLTDDDTGSTVETVDAVVSGVRLRPDTGELQIVGTADDDHVSINQRGRGFLTVHANFLPRAKSETFDATDVDQIVAFLCDGDDHLTIAGNVRIPAIVRGGNDNDHIKSGGGPTVLLGNAGDDTLIGSGALSILIGGGGSDRLVGGSARDVLVGGGASEENSDLALITALTALSTIDDYDLLVAAIPLLLTVQDDETEDLINGGAARDIFFDGLGDRLIDVKLKKNPESVL